MRFQLVKARLPRKSSLEQTNRARKYKATENSRVLDKSVLNVFSKFEKLKETYTKAAKALLAPKPFFMPKAKLSIVFAALFLSACSQTFEPTSNAAKNPIPKATQELLLKKGMRISAPIFIRIYKKESELEIWKQKDDGLFYPFKSYPICNWSGKLGPKLKQGDKQAPEGFYRVSRGQMNPNSKFHLSFNLGYPNQYDRSLNRTGANLMVHGDCKSAGCYAMTDALVEEIYAIAREAFDGGQKSFDVHAYPFRMTTKNMEKHRRSRWIKFWRVLKTGYDEFEQTRIPPVVRVCERRYHVNPAFANVNFQINPAGPCPGSPGFRPMRRTPKLTIAGQEPKRDPIQEVLRDTTDESTNRDRGFDQLSLPDDLFSEDLGGSSLRNGVY